MFCCWTINVYGMVNIPWHYGVHDRLYYALVAALWFQLRAYVICIASAWRVRVASSQALQRTDQSLSLLGPGAREQRREPCRFQATRQCTFHTRPLNRQSVSAVAGVASSDSLPSPVRPFRSFDFPTHPPV